MFKRSMTRKIQRCHDLAYDYAYINVTGLPTDPMSSVQVNDQSFMFTRLYKVTTGDLYEEMVFVQITGPQNYEEALYVADPISLFENWLKQFIVAFEEDVPF